jgi:circadian clock protein KaiC
MADLVGTGIEGLDELLNGGLPAGGTYALVGASGTGKSILSFQYLFNGITKFDEAGVYILLEEDKEPFARNISGFGWDLSALEASGKLACIPFTKSIVGDIEATFEKGALSGDTDRANQLRQYLTIDSLYEHIRESVERIGARRVVIDSMTVITLLSSSQLVARMQLLWLIQRLRRLNVTSIITIEEGIGYWRDTLFLCDGIIGVMLRERAGIFERGLVIEKIRGAGHDTGVRPLKIGQQGIRVYPHEVISPQR